MDFDGVFTDNRVLVFQDSQEAVLCDRGDGMGLSMLQKAGYPLYVLSKERNPVLLARLDKLGIACEHGVDDKLTMLSAWASRNSFSLENLVYVGNDINDVPCLKAVGCGVVVNDAHTHAISVADIVLEKKGGYGALRELSDLILGSSDHKQIEVMS